MIVSTYFLTWKVFLASWTRDWNKQQETIAKLNKHFQPIQSIPANLGWNVVFFSLCQASLLHAAGFSEDFQRFCYTWVVSPCLVGSLAYYCFKFGTAIFWKSLSVENCLQWIYNWIAMQGIALACLTQTAVFYVLGIVLEPILLPANLQVSVKFPTELIEEYLTLGVYYFAGLFCVCLVTLPLWQKGYQVSMEAAGRGRISISLLETFMELMYQTSQSGSILFLWAPICLLLQNKFGLGVHPMHVMFTAVEVGLINYVVEYKFCIVHQLLHEIKPLYSMVHIEHHVCKGIHPTTPSTGLWEVWVNGGGMFFTSFFGMQPIPYAALQSIYVGANIVVHTMWPSRKLLQWHTLHHTVLADIYNVNIPSPYDEGHSRTYKQLNEALRKESVFIRYEAISDLVGFAFIAIWGLFFHYGLGVGAFHADWSQVEWIYRSPLSV